LPPASRGNALGTFQANVGIWQILARQGQISNSHLNDSWQRVIKPFATFDQLPKCMTRVDLPWRTIPIFDRQGTVSQDEIIDLLAGPRQNSSEGRQMHREIAARIRSVLTTSDWFRSTRS